MKTHDPDKHAAMEGDQEDRRFLMPSALLSLLVHGLLVVALFFAIDWHTTEQPIYAELWAPEDMSAGKDIQGVSEKRELQSKNQQAQTKQPSQPEDNQSSADQVDQKAQNEQKATRENNERVAREQARAEDIQRMRDDAIEAEKQRQQKLKDEEQKRLAQEKLAQARKQAEEQKKALEAKRLAEQKKAEADRQRRLAAEQARLERERLQKTLVQQELARLNSTTTPNATRSGTTAGDPSNYKRNLSGAQLTAYQARVIQCIRPHIAYPVGYGIVRGQYQFEVQIRLLPTGEQSGDPRVTKPSGLPAYDEAVLRAISQCNPFPRPDNDEAPREMTLLFDPVDDRQ